MTRTILTLVAATLVASALGASESDEIPRSADGHPDLSGTYDIATLTPLQRPTEFGDNLYLTQEQADKIMKDRDRYVESLSGPSDASREAPPEGGDGSTGASGNVGGYNYFWIDPGDSLVMVDGKFRTSIITDPKNGRQPPRTPESMSQARVLGDLFRPNDGTAYWIDWDRPGPFDNPEQMLASDRCLASFRSVVPSLPSLYNNLQRIVQTEDNVLIHNEMIHDARVVRMNAEHRPPEMRFWLGDSVGRWEGDTLVVDTTNFRSYTGFASTTETLHVVERFTRVDADTLRYEFTVEDPSVWTGPWTGDFVWPATEGKVYEYACAEGNYALGGMLRGARVLEADALKAKTAD